MAEKKKMSVAEILAAARKADNKSGNGDETTGAAPAEPSSAPAAEEAVATPAGDISPASQAETPKPAAKPAAASTPGKRPSVADIMAAARANKPAAAAAPAEKPAPKPAAAKPVVAKEAAKPAPVLKSGEKDTASILAAARKGVKPGPVSKAEAATLAKPAAAPAARETKGKLVVPPMPAKPAAAAKKPVKAAAGSEEDRRGFLSMALGSFLGLGFVGLGVTSGLWGLGVARFMFPNILTEPPSTFKVGPPSDFPPGAVSDKFKAQFGVWVVSGEYNGQPQIYALKTVCTHLGCTPNWLEAEQKFKCPCHGSGFYKDGINFEGPAPRPLERYAIRLADDGQVEIDKSKKFQEELGQWADPSSFVPV